MRQRLFGRLFYDSSAINRRPQGANMEKVIAIFDWWDGPLCGLATFGASICIYERIFDEAKDDWSNEYYLMPIEDDAVSRLRAEWDAWCKKIQTGDAGDGRALANKGLCRSIVEASAQKRAYRKTAAFSGRFGKGYIPIDYRVKWI